MSKEEKDLLMLKGILSDLPAGQEKACKELSEHILTLCKTAGSPVGELALAMAGMKAQLALE
jgi:hypothetical protein